MRHAIMLLLCALLGACASAPPAEGPTQLLLKDALFEPPARPVDAREIFALSPEMRSYLEKELIPKLRGGSQRQLVETLYKQRDLRLEYDSVRTRSAAEAFASRSGNCLSLVIMTAAFAKELQLPVHYQSAVLDETWSRNGDFYFASGHVNLAIGRRLVDRYSVYDVEDYVTVDFLPASEIRGLRTREIPEPTVVAMYMNNRAAEALAAGRASEAYWWSREAVRNAPAFMPAYNTLGVVYLQSGHAAEADKVFAHVLAGHPSNVQAMANRTIALRSLGRTEESRALAEQLARIEPNPPFAFFKRGMAAMESGDYRAARDWFAKEVDRAAYYHEFQFWLGMANLRLGDLGEARKHLELAMDSSTTRNDRALYSAKLDRLKGHVTQ